MTKRNTGYKTKLFRQLSIYAICLLMPVILSSCFAVRMAYQNTGKVLFDEPKKIKNKITDPVKDDVKLSALWIGHSSVLLQMEDKVLLIDPVFNEVIGGLMLRASEPGIELKNIPRLDAILVSHAHMDHLSINTVDEINDLKRFKGARLIFPNGVEDFLPDYPNLEMIRLGTGNTRKQGYIGESVEFNGMKVTSVFTSHYGGRFGFDSYLWHLPGCTGFVVEYKGHTVFYPGDTVYDEIAFKEIGNRFDIDLALIPIGPCRDCMEVDNHNHVTSFGALKMFEDVKADYMIPVHYGTITYANDTDEPVHALRELIGSGVTGSSGSGTEAENTLSKRVIILNEGEQHIFK